MCVWKLLVFIINKVWNADKLEMLNVTPKFDVLDGYDHTGFCRERYKMSIKITF